MLNYGIDWKYKFCVGGSMHHDNPLPIKVKWEKKPHLTIGEKKERESLGDYMKLHSREF